MKFLFFVYNLEMGDCIIKKRKKRESMQHAYAIWYGIHEAVASIQSICLRIASNVRNETQKD
jgi:hypothetical protein